MLFPIQGFPRYIQCLCVYASLFFSRFRLLPFSLFSRTGSGRFHIQQGIRAKVSNLLVVEIWMTHRWDGQANRLQLLCVEVEDERYAHV